MFGESVFLMVVYGFEVLGVLAMIVGFVLGLIVSTRLLVQGSGGSTAFHALRTTFGSAILLGLELFVAADLILTITSKPSMGDVLILSVVVAVRTVLSITLQIEMDGVVPWKRALFVSGGQLLARSVSDAQRSHRVSTASNAGVDGGAGAGAGASGAGASGADAGGVGAGVDAPGSVGTS